MFDLSFEHIFFTVIVAIIVIGPKDLPRAMRTAGQWMGKVRRVSGHFRAGIETMIREAEIEDMEKQWREQNEAIMAAHPPAPASAEPLAGIDPGTLMEPLPPPAKPAAKKRPAAKKPAAKKSGAKLRAKAAK